MTTSLCPTDEIALFSEDGKTWFGEHGPDQQRGLTWEPNDAVTKIVIGTPPIGDAKQELAVSIPENLAELYPNLAHLHLWQISDLEQLPDVPDGLLCLDVRGCRTLAHWSPLPNNLETLVMDGCGLLPSPERTSWPRLTEISVRGCVRIQEKWLHEILRSNQSLRYFDASDCTQLTRIPGWAESLIDIRLDRCTRLKSLPTAWPQGLRRLGLRGDESVQSLPNFIPSMDYIDLARTRSLRRLPRERGNARSLFLFGSGVLEPPATEHGSAVDENVAHSTAAYFADRALTGDGKVRRCKVLVLGNGGAGKTCLSLALTGRDPKEAAKLGSTHAVQFWDWELKANCEGTMEDAHLHLWDFGGQEIYHNTHRLFMSKGAIFLLLWNPDETPEPDGLDGDYQDELRPLRYWLDFIHLACPHKPRIAIVCSRHTTETPELEARWRAQVPEELGDGCKCFYIDSLYRQGQLDDLELWLQDEVGDVVATQGSAVPAYWEIVQDMVEGWVKRLADDPEFAATHNQLRPDQFRDDLWAAIAESISGDGKCPFPKLRDAINSGEFELDEDRLRRTLSFLTHSGWIYWDPELFEGRVIIGQRWALDGLYAILDRRKGSLTYRELSDADGRFTLSDLGSLAWDQMGFGTHEQQLLLSYMEQCGLCFKLRSADEAWREEDVYVSFEHLPTEKQLRLTRDFERRRGTRKSADVALRIDKLHKQHWQNLLTHAGSKYGKNAHYAADALFTANELGQLILIRCEFDPSGLGGEIEINVAGTDAEARLSEVRQLVLRFLPGAEDASLDRRSIEDSLGKAVEHQEVFISYAWNPPANAADSGIPAGYEQPVDEIERFLSSWSFRLDHGEKRKSVKLVRDKTATKFGDSLRTFMKNGAKHPHVIVVHSDKYWRSPDCIFELSCLFDQLQEEREKDIDTVLIPIEHLNSRIGDAESRDELLRFWRMYKGEVPARCFAGKQELKDVAAYVIRRFSKIVSDKLALDIRWSRGVEAALSEIARRLNLPVPGRDQDG